MSQYIENYRKKSRAFDFLGRDNIGDIRKKTGKFYGKMSTQKIGIKLGLINYA